MVSGPATLAAAAETQDEPPARDHEETFSGYGIMGVPFASGHVLAMRRFPASSVGPSYTSIWRRNPDGNWVFWQDQPDTMACPRYFSAALAETRHVPIQLGWPSESTLRLAVPDQDFEWTATMASSPVTRLLNTAASLIPERGWRTHGVLSLMGSVAGTTLRAGKVDLYGSVPNGQQFIANPRTIWVVVETTARLGGLDFGPMGPLVEQTRLGDFWIPQRGIFAMGRAFFTNA